MAAKPLTLLEQWLEGVPHRDPDSVKEEKREFIPSSSSSSSSHFLNPASFAAPLVPQSAPPPPAAPPEPKVKTEDKTVDSQSGDGIFGWESIRGTVVPVIYRGTEGLVPVKIVESKIISQFSNCLTWTVFSCINIRSFYVTDKEAALLNEINGQHCDYFFGYETFTSKDVVVCLQDVFTLRAFLETSKIIFQFGLSKLSADWIGFVDISGAMIVPFISKETPNSSRKRYVPQSLIQNKILLDKVTRIEMDEWDASYIRMLLIYAGLEHLNLMPDDLLCSLDDMMYDLSFCPIRIKQCTPSLANPAFSPVPKSMNSYATTSNSQTLDTLQDDAWLRSSTASSPNTTLRSLHQVTTVDICGLHLRAINLKAYSNQQAVFVGEVVNKIFRGSVPLLTVLHILSQILQVKLYECTRLHEDAFLRSNYVPLHGDKLILTDVLKKCLPQLRQVILAGFGVGPSSALYSSHH